jgi:hypothetical protein
MLAGGFQSILNDADSLVPQIFITFRALLDPLLRAQAATPGCYERALAILSNKKAVLRLQDIVSKRCHDCSQSMDRPVSIARYK